MSEQGFQKGKQKIKKGNVLRLKNYMIFKTKVKKKKNVFLKTLRQIISLKSIYHLYFLYKNFEITRTIYSNSERSEQLF